MGMSEAIAALDKANEGFGKSIGPAVTSQTMVTREEDRAQAGGKTVDKVMAETMRETNRQGGNSSMITGELEKSQMGGKSLEKVMGESARTGDLTGKIVQKDAPITETLDTIQTEASRNESQGTEVHGGAREENTISPQFEAIQRQMRKVRQEQIRVKQERDNLTREKAELEGLKKLQSEIKRNPMKALESAGISYKQLTDSLLSGNGQTPELAVSEVRDELKALKDKMLSDQQEADRKRKLNAQREAQQVETDYLQDIYDFGRTNQDTYELVNLNGAQQQVFQVIDGHFQKTGKVMSIKQGYDILEKLMEDQIEKNLQSRKWQMRAGRNLPKDSPTKSAQDTRTLTNNMTSSAPSFLPARSEEERIQRALAALSK